MDKYATGQILILFETHKFTNKFKAFERINGNKKGS